MHILASGAKITKVMQWHSPDARWPHVDGGWVRLIAGSAVSFVQFQATVFESTHGTMEKKKDDVLGTHAAQITAKPEVKSRDTTTEIATEATAKAKK